MKFVNRYTEIAKIQSFISNSTPFLGVIYGRRRCGKSAILKKILRNIDIYHQCDLQESIMQRKSIGQGLKTYIPEIDSLTFKNWESFFETISARIPPLSVLVLDEFPYLVKVSPEIISVIQKLIDLNKLSFHLILCGSAQQMMQGMVLDKNEPLYGRADLILKIKPLKVGYLQEAMELDDSIACIEEYAVWGGVPRYWKLRMNYSDRKEAIKSLIFDGDALLSEEPIRLLADDMRSSIQAISILNLIGNGVSKVSELAARLNKPATALSRPLQQLIDLDIIKRDIPFGDLEKNSKRSFYSISDPFMHFYFQFVQNNKSLLAIGLMDKVMESVDQKWNQFVSIRYEQLCRDAIPYSNLFEINWGHAQRWWPGAGMNQGTEIDLVAESLDRQSILIGEVKWIHNPNIHQIIEELNKKIESISHIVQKRKIYKVICLKSLNQSSYYNENTLLVGSDLILKYNK